MYAVNIKINKQGILWKGSIFMLLGIFLTSCDLGYELPEANSIPDETPPSASFDYKQNELDFLQIDFINLSSSATDFSWDFGDGNTSTEMEPSHTYPSIGRYTVTLTVSDKLGATSTTSKEVLIEEPAFVLPVIHEAGFEDNSLPDGTGDGRDSWRNDLGGVIQITSGPVYEGEQAAKLPSGGDRVGHQTVAVVPNTDYRLSFYYTMKSDPGTLTVSILDRDISDLSEAGGATIASVDLTDNSDPNTFVNVILEFNSGDNSAVGILFTNVDSECRLDSFEFIE